MPIPPFYENDYEFAIRNLDRQYNEAREAIYRSYGERDRYYNWGWNRTYIYQQPYYPEPYSYTIKYLNSTTGEMSMPLVSPTETKKFIIISSAGAAEHPTEHKTLAEAEAEATRLAKQFPKQEFTVYVTQKSFKVADKPVDVKVFA